MKKIIFFDQILKFFITILLFSFSNLYAVNPTCPNGEIIKNLKITDARLYITNSAGSGAWFFNTEKFNYKEHVWNAYIGLIWLPTTNSQQAMNKAQAELSKLITVKTPTPVKDDDGKIRCIYHKVHHSEVVMALTPAGPPVSFDPR